MYVHAYVVLMYNILKYKYKYIYYNILKKHSNEKPKMSNILVS